MFILQTKEDYDVRAIVFFLFAQKIENPLSPLFAQKNGNIPYLLTTKTPNLWLTPFLLSERKR